MPYVPETSFRRDSLGYCGDANKLFLTFLFSDHAIGLQFLKDVGLIRSKVQCNSCGFDMTWHADQRDLQLSVPVRQRHLATQLSHSPLDHLFYTEHLQVSEVLSYFFYSLTLLTVLLLNSIPHYLLSCFINTSGMRAQSSVQDVGFIRSKVQSNFCSSDMTRHADPRDLQLFVPVRLRHLATQVCHSLLDHLFYSEHLQVREVLSYIFYSLTLLIVLLLNSIPHFLLQCFINTSFSTSSMRAQSSVQALFPRCLSPSNIAVITLLRMTPPIAAILDSLISSRSWRRASSLTRERERESS